MAARVTTFVLKHPGSCTGMMWRRAPTVQGAPLSHALPTGNAVAEDWPRNGALLRGVVRALPEAQEGNTQWLEVFEFQQAGATAFVPTPNAWMIFDQGGLLLQAVQA